MFNKGDVYTIDGGAIKWVGVVTGSVNELGSVTATEICFSKRTGQLVALEAAAYFNVDRPGQRVLLHE
jgi:hypothetical protein